MNKRARETVDSWTGKHRAAGAPISEQQRRSVHDLIAITIVINEDEPLVPLDQRIPPSPAVAPAGDEGQRRLLVVAAADPGAEEVFWETCLGSVEGDEDCGWDHGIWWFLMFGGEFEDFKPVFGDEDTHALEEFVVEVNDVVFLELVLQESQAVLVD